MKLTSESKFLLIIAISTLAIIIGAVFLLTKPPQTPKSLDKASLIPNGVFTKGNSNASAYLVEFSDFQCPACKNFQPVITQILNKYGDSLQFAYRHYPLETKHPFALKAALAAEAAGKQGKFWEMHDLLFENQEQFNDEIFTQLAQNLGLDTEQFKKDIKSNEINTKVQQDISFGNQIRINSTPTFFLNGQKLTITNINGFMKDVEQAVNQP